MLLLNYSRMVLSSQLKFGISNIRLGGNILSKYENIFARTLNLRKVFSSDNCTSELIEVTFISNNKKFTVIGKRGDSFLDVVRNYDLNFDGFGVCEGNVECTTCHLITKPEDYKNFEPANDNESDMLSIMEGVTEFSRLGCQLKLTEQMAGIEVTIPDRREDIRDEFAENNDTS